MTPEQRALARHALGLDNHDAGGKSYRNRYLAARGSFEANEWRAMVIAGHAKEGTTANVGTWFYLTEAGARAALKKGERLCLEDFPQVSA